MKIMLIFIVYSITQTLKSISILFYASYAILLFPFIVRIKATRDYHIEIPKA